MAYRETPYYSHTGKTRPCCILVSLHKLNWFNVWWNTRDPFQWRMCIYNTDSVFSIPNCIKSRKDRRYHWICFTFLFFSFYSSFRPGGRVDWLILFNFLCHCFRESRLYLQMYSMIFIQWQLFCYHFEPIFSLFSFLFFCHHKFHFWCRYRFY